MEFRRWIQPASEDQSHREGSGLSVAPKQQDSSGNVAFERGLAGWFLRWWRRRAVPVSRLRLLDRIAIGPRHALVLVEVDGVRLLVATAPEGATTLFPLQAAITPAPSLSQHQPSTSNVLVNQGLGLVKQPGKAEVRTSSRAASQSRVSW